MGEESEGGDGKKRTKSGKKVFLINYGAKEKMVSGMLNLEDLYFFRSFRGKNGKKRIKRN